MSVIFIASDKRGVGKTALASALAVQAREEGRDVALIKAFGNPEVSGSDIDDGDFIYFDSLLTGIDRTTIAPPIEWIQSDLEGMTSGGNDSFKQHITGRWPSIKDEKILNIIEGPSSDSGGGLGANLSKMFSESVDARLLLVAGFASDLGCNIELVTKPFGDSLSGVIVNAVTKHRSHFVETDIMSTIRKTGVNWLGAIPEDRFMLSVTVEQVAQHLDGEFHSWAEKKDNLVSHFMIGGLVLDSGIAYFQQRSEKAVIVRWDRPDLQMAALETPTACMILTGGKPPTQYIEYQINEAEVPAIIIDQGTREAAAALEQLMNETTVRDVRKATRFLQLMTENLDLGAVLGDL